MIQASDTNGALERARRGLGCEGPDELRIALLGVLCEASAYRPQAMSSTMPYAEELMRRSPRGSTPWAQGAYAKLSASIVSPR